MSCSSRILCSCLCSEKQRGCNTHASLSWAPWTTVEPFCQHLHWSLCWSWLSTGSSLPFFGQSASGSLSTLSEEKLGLSSEPQAWGKMSFADALGLAVWVLHMEILGIPPGTPYVSVLAAESKARGCQSRWSRSLLMRCLILSQALLPARGQWWC